MYIIFEGVDGVGKSTQVEEVANVLRYKHFKEVYLTKEPGSTKDIPNSFRDKIRELLINSDIDTLTELLLFFADRNEHMKQIQSLLDKGAYVISDRSFISSYAYQVANLDDDVKDIFKWLVAKIQIEPDLIFFLKADEDVFRKRIIGRGNEDRFEKRDLSKIQQNMEFFLKRYYGDKVVVLDAGLPVKDINRTIVKHILGKNEE